MTIELDIERNHPNVTGDLPGVLDGAPMFGRAVAGYDRFQVDTYVRWAEDELATADREREHLMALYLRTQAALDEAQQRLSHSAGGGELLQLSRRIGTMLASAADDAEGIRAEARADRAATAAEGRRVLASAERVLAEAEATAQRLVDEATTAAAAVTADAARVLADAEAIRQAARNEATACRAELEVLRQRAAEDAAAVRRRAADDAAAALLQARQEIVSSLGTAREQRRRADEAAEAARAARHRVPTGSLPTT
jgi:colicin import membrane protein